MILSKIVYARVLGVLSAFFAGLKSTCKNTKNKATGSDLCPIINTWQQVYWGRHDQRACLLLAFL